MSQFDFVTAHRHVNPDGSLGGLVDDTADVSPTSVGARDCVRLREFVTACALKEDQSYVKMSY